MYRSHRSGHDHIDAGHDRASRIQVRGLGYDDRSGYDHDGDIERDFLRIHGGSHCGERRNQLQRNTILNATQEEEK